MNAASQPAARALSRDSRGAALIVFALLLPPLLVLLALLIDLGFCFNARLNTLRGVTAGAMFAFQNGGAVTAGTATDLRNTIVSIVQDGAGSTAPTATVLINNAAGTQNADNFYCTAGYPVQWTSTGSTSGSCADGTTSAKFVTITTSGTAALPIPLASFAGQIFPMTETIVVRAK